MPKRRHPEFKPITSTKEKPAQIKTSEYKYRIKVTVNPKNRNINDDLIPSAGV